MTYGVIVRVPAPIEVYDAVHLAVVRAMAGEVPDGMILHTARATDQGFEVFELWESKEQCETSQRTVVGPAMADSGVPMDGPPPETIEFEPRTVLAVRVYSTDPAGV